MRSGAIAYERSWKSQIAKSLALICWARSGSIIHGRIDRLDHQEDRARRAGRHISCSLGRNRCIRIIPATWDSKDYGEASRVGGICVSLDRRALAATPSTLSSCCAGKRIALTGQRMAPFGLSASKTGLG